MNVIELLSQIAVFFPLFGFFLGGLCIWYKGNRTAQIITCLFAFISFLLSLYLFHKIALNHEAHTFVLTQWIDIGHFKATWGLKLDTLSTTMMVVVTSVSFLVHIYSIGYMSHDSSIPRFMSYLSLFTFMMLSLITAPNMLQLFFGWEGVGLASYLLIGFWYERDSANEASMKAFLVNRVGDVGLVLGICTLYHVFGTLGFDDIFSQLSNDSPSFLSTSERPTYLFFGYDLDLFNLIALLLFIGAMGKSAQIGLHTWLPDAMEGPTPVSALIHAATMVTAGVFLLARLSPLYEMAPLAREVIVIVGILTAFFAATIALVQTDIKRVIAYSTCSQLGYMFFAAGCSAYSASIFHLVTHAFFKALLFLGAGSVIHAMSDEQNMMKMGGIYRIIPATYGFMWIGSLAISGIPFFSGYYSKDAILEAAYNHSHFSFSGDIAFFGGLFVAFLTAFYSCRLLFLTFHGRPQANDIIMAHAHESPISMLIPLGLLSVGAILSGYFGFSLFIENQNDFWNGSIALQSSHPSHSSIIIENLPLLCAVSGLFLAFTLYGKYRYFLDDLCKKCSSIYKFLSHKWFFDELYNFIFVSPLLRLGKIFWKKGDEQIIDRFGPNGIAQFSLKTAYFTSRFQTGHLYHYAFSMLLGVFCFISWYFLIKGGR